MGTYLKETDSLARHINDAAAKLHSLLQQLDVDSLGMPENCLIYFKGSHFKRLHFSIETSAHLLYRSIKHAGKNPQESVIMDYGAGVGTLYTLAKMIGCRTVIYNDHLPEWRYCAEQIAKAIGIAVDYYLVGDIDDTLSSLKHLGIKTDIITSRNVIEHIYKLEDFYAAVSAAQPWALIYSSTTANYYNPGSRLQHSLWHKKWEKIYFKERHDFLKGQFPGLPPEKTVQLATATRGLSFKDIPEYLKSFEKTGRLPEPACFGSNTCEPATGVWAENMLPFSIHSSKIKAGKFTPQFEPGFWDTHYGKPWKNRMGALLNSAGRHFRWLGFATAPFIYVIAVPENSPA